VSHGPSTNGAAARLDAARLIGVGVAGLLGQLAVDMPGGYFGPWDTTTPAGRWFGAVLIGSVMLAAGLRLGRRRVAPVMAVVPTLNVVAFLQPLASDPIPSGLVVGWSLVVLGRLLMPQRHEPARSLMHPATDDDPVERWLMRNGGAARHLTTVALVGTIAVVGYRVGMTSLVRTLTLAGDLVLVVWMMPALVRLASRRRPLSWIALTLATCSVAMAFRPELALVLATACLAAILMLLVSQTPLFADLLDHFFGRPALLVLVSFLVLISLGTMLLSFPAAAVDGGSISPLDALFTATSASCVTGLIVLDTPHDLSGFGQWVILILIQAGGLNIMVLSTFAAVLLGRGLGLKGEQALGELLELRAVRSAYRLIVFIVITTLAVETAGAVVIGFVLLDHGYGLGEAVWGGVFHSVSAFCNAGFALQSDSLVPFQEDPALLLTMAGLITLGGLGFAVLAVIWLRLTGRRRIGLAVQVKVVLATSIALVVLGWLGFAAFEWGGVLSDLETGDRLLNALFQSVTSRTAGFNSVPLEGLQPTTTLLLMTLMFIGASPGGTGGGIKTTTVVVLLSVIPAVARRRPQVVLFGRRLTLDTIYRSAVIAVVGALVVVGAAMLLLASQATGPGGLVFEAVSAFGTVGLSLGATPSLDAFGKMVVIAVMLTGRIGPLSLALLLGRTVGTRLGYPEASLMVG
jgi:trk system potassium uptake protein